MTDGFENNCRQDVLYFPLFDKDVGGADPVVLGSSSEKDLTEPMIGILK
ncbi:MAG: hypothetical protein WCF03_13265 [Nitrososphaeraceae archaeon]